MANPFHFWQKLLSRVGLGKSDIQNRKRYDEEIKELLKFVEKEGFYP
jgi:hypothetical protein